MITKLIFYLPLILITTYSCSFFTKKVELLATPGINETKISKTNRREIYCPSTNQLQFLFEDDSTQKYFKPYIENIFHAKKYNFIQKTAMLALIEMLRRPDEASPSARLQYFLRYKDKDYYFDFHPHNRLDKNKMSYLKGIDYLLVHFNNTKKLEQLSDEMSKYLADTINVSPEFESFLQSYQSKISKNEILAKIFLKGDEPLTRHETYKRNNLNSIFKIFRSKQNDKDSNYDFLTDQILSVKEDNGSTIKCNFDINDNPKLKNELNTKDQKKSHYFGIKEDNNYFIAVSSNEIDNPMNTYNSTYFLKSQPTSNPLPLCHFENDTQNIVLFSSSGRSPAQHLSHLITYDINSIDSFESLDEMLKFSRHLFLNNPDRILYESTKGRKEQINYFLTMNFPIYHVDSIGDIIGAALFKKEANDQEEISLINDNRSKARLWCGQ